MTSIKLRTALAVFGVGAIVLSGLAYAVGNLQASTKKDLMDAMHGEAFATLKYMAYADAARAHGNTQLADLFERTANIEHREHFAEHVRLAGLVGTDSENLKDAIKGENYETTEMYPQMAKRAEAAGDRQAAEHFREIGADEAKHRDAYQAALGRIAAK